MSMVLFLAKMPPATAERIKANPDLLPQVQDELDESDRLMEDYLHLGRIVNEEPDRYPWMQRALHGTGEEIAFEYGYGPGFLITAQEAAQIATGLAEEGWWRPGDPIVTVDHAIASFYASAGHSGHIIIGGIS